MKRTPSNGVLLTGLYASLRDPAADFENVRRRKRDLQGVGSRPHRLPVGGVVMAVLLGCVLPSLECGRQQSAGDSFTARPTEKAQSTGNRPADVYLDLRRQVLSLDAKSLARTSGTSGEVYGVVMETAYPEGIVTLVALSDGTVSLYFSGGGGVIGAGEEEGARKASADFLATAQAALRHGIHASTFPLPSPGYTQFFFLTPGGVRTIQALENDLGEGRHVLSPLFHKGHAVIAEVMRARSGPARGSRGAPRGPRE